MSNKMKEIIFYSVITIMLILICMLNKYVWKFGEDSKQELNTETSTYQMLEVDGKKYNVPYEEEWLD